MTACNRDSLVFSRLGPQAVVADFQGGQLTSDACALLIREVGQRLGLFDDLDRAFPDPRFASLIMHEQETMLAQRIIALALAGWHAHVFAVFSETLAPPPGI
jgi:hypothetical protein